MIATETESIDIARGIPETEGTHETGETRESEMEETTDTDTNERGSGTETRANANRIVIGSDTTGSDMTIRTAVDVDAKMRGPR